MEPPVSRWHPALHTARRLLRGARDTLGVAGVAGAALLLLASLGLADALRTQRQSESLDDATETARAQATRSASAGRDRSPAEQMAQFRRWFPPASQSTSDLRAIFAAAEAAHVELARGEYSVRAVEGLGGIERFDAVFPVKEHYAPVKAFVAEVLNRLPHASLDELRVERPQSAAEQLESRVHFTMFYREANP